MEVGEAGGMAVVQAQATGAEVTARRVDTPAAQGGVALRAVAWETKVAMGALAGR